MYNLDVVFKIGQSMTLPLCLELSEHENRVKLAQKTAGRRLGHPRCAASHMLRKGWHLPPSRKEL